MAVWETPFVDVLLIVAVLAIVVVVDRRRARAGRGHVEAWAAGRGLSVESCRYRYLRLLRRPQFPVVMRDRDGRRAEGLATVAGRGGRRTRVELESELATSA